MRFPPLEVIGGFPHGLYKATCSISIIPDSNNPGYPTWGIPGYCVEVAGFEPAAFWSRTKRATKLRYTSKLSR